MVLGLAVALIGAGCTVSKVASEAPIHLTGTVVDAEGRPVAGAPLRLFKEVDFGEALGGLTLALATLGAACFLSNGPAVCARARKATSGPSGGFSFDLTGRDTQGSVGNADSFDLTTLLPPSSGGPARAATTVRFRIQRTTLAIPALRAWGGPIQVTDGRPAVGVGWTPLPASGYGASPSYSVQFVDRTTQQAVATVAGASPGASVDSRWLEDRSGEAEVDASTRQKGPGTDFVFTYRSQTAPFQGHASPPSRGAQCFASTAAQPPAPVNPCRLTDGDLFTPGSVAGDSVYVDLARPTSIGLVVVRGGSSALAIESSTDAKAWNPLGNTSGGFSPVKPAGATTARYIRVRSTSGASAANLTEISVWP
ncbi:MAG: hypothetical protein QOJ52_2776 [Acidimicrobiaceae bacterium]|nr:hypothetical protein [Acidimicrobiaceae bacterium]